MNSIESQLSKSGLPSIVVESPADVGRAFRGVRDGSAFLMDIRRDKKGERFVIRPGDAIVQVVNVDKDVRQAILFVHEKESEIKFSQWDPKLRKSVLLTRKVSAVKRHFLMGMDESHLFVCQLPKPVATVADAHSILAPEKIRSRRDDKKKVVRQGEWFFVPVEDQKTLRQIGDYISRLGILKNHRIGPANRRGRPHIVDEMIRVPIRVNLSEAERDSILNEFRAVGGHRRFGVRLNNGTIAHTENDLPSFRTEAVEYVRGSVKHPDHHALHLRGWHSVSVNTERTDADVRGMTWID